MFRMSESAMMHLNDPCEMAPRSLDTTMVTQAHLEVAAGRGVYTVVSR